MPKYRSLNNDTEINVDGVRVIASTDGTFNAATGSRLEAVLLAGGALSADATLTPAAAAAAQAAFGGATPVSSPRPFLVSFGDSIASQDRPQALSNGAPLAISPMTWVNALTHCAFDLLGPTQTAYTPDGAQNVAGQIFENGVMGYSGGLITQFMASNIDRFLGYVAAQLPAGRTAYVMLGGGMNDFNNNDLVAHDATVYALYLPMVEKIIARGWVPILKCGEQSININTANKLRNRAAWRDRLLNLGVQRSIPVMDVGTAFRKYAAGVSYERMTRGATGDEVHPNSMGALIYGFAGRDALRGRVAFVPPYERADFTGTIASTGFDMAGTAGTKGTNANGAAVVPTGQTLNAFGAANTVNSSKGNYGAGPGVFLDCTASAAPTADRIGFDGAGITPNTTDVYRAYTDLDVIQANYVTQIGGFVRHTGAAIFGMPNIAGTDNRSMTADQPNAWKLLEGERIVVSSFPFNFDPASSGAYFSAGGGSGLTDVAGRLRTFTRFAGLVR